MLELRDADGNALSLDDTNPVDFGTVDAGTTGTAVEARVANTGDATAYFVKVRSIAHPTAQVGAAKDTYEAAELALTQAGSFGDEVELGTIDAGTEKAFWVRWSVPADAPAGSVVWAVEAVGSET